MKIVISSTGKELGASVDPRLGRARYFIFYDTDTDEWKAYDNSENVDAAQGAGIQSAQKIVNLGAEAVITGHCGPKAFSVLEAGEVTVYCFEGSVEEAINALKENKLTPENNATVPAHCGLRNGGLCTGGSSQR